MSDFKPQPKTKTKTYTIEDVEEIIKTAVDLGNSMGFGLRVMSGHVHVTPGQHTPDQDSVDSCIKKLNAIIG
jgi:hypothetical protein